MANKPIADNSPMWMARLVFQPTLGEMMISYILRLIRFLRGTNNTTS